MSRRKLQEEVGQTEPEWIEPDLTSLPDTSRATYDRNRDSLLAYIGGVTVGVIEERYGVHRQQLARSLKRALTLDSVGKQYGFRACVPNFHVNAATRRSPIKQEHKLRGRGLACAMQAVIESSSSTQALVEALLPEFGKRMTRKRFEQAFRRFNTIVSKALPADSYPLYLPDHGREAFRRYLKRRAKQYSRDAQALDPPVRFAPMPGDGTGQPSLALQRDIYDETEMDGWLEPVDMEVLIPSFSDDSSPLRISGIGLLVIMDRKSHCVLGKQLLLTCSYDTIDFLLCIQNALEKWVPRDLQVPSFQYDPGSGLPSGLHPRAVGRMWDILFLDNARVHISAITRDALLRKVPCHLNFGRAGEPTARPIVERFFGHMSELWTKELLPKRQSTYRKHTKGVRLDYAVPMAWIEDLFDLIVARYNATPHALLQQKTPLQVMLHALDREAGWGRSDGSEQAAWRGITHIEVECDLIRPKGRSPYVNYASGRYGSNVLRSTDLSMDVHPKLVIDVNILDLQYVGAKFKGGESIGLLEVRPPWLGEKHDLSLRRIIAKSMRRKGEPLRSSDNIVQTFREGLRERAKTSKQAASLLAKQAMRGGMSGDSEPKSKVGREKRHASRGWIRVDDA